MDSSNIPGFTAENSLERNDRPYLLYRSHLTSESVIPQVLPGLGILCDDDEESCSCTGYVGCFLLGLFYTTGNCICTPEDIDPPFCLCEIIHEEE